MKKMIIVLIVVTLLSGLSLSVIYQQFKGKIEQNEIKALQDALKVVLPNAAKFEEIPSDQMLIYKGLDSSGNIVGYAVNVSGNGYQDVIKMLVSLSPDLTKIYKIAILDQKETPGLGAKIEEDFFKSQFEGLKPDMAITYVKNATADKSKNQIEAISGATISSKSVVKALNSELAKALEIIKQAQ